MSTILGAHSPKVEAVRVLRTKAGRVERGLFAIEGATLLAEAVAAGRYPESVWVTERGARTLPAQLRAAYDDRTYVVPDRTMTRLSELETPPGILAVIRSAVESAEDLLDGAPVVFLAGVADPGNAGTLVRAAEIFGIARTIFARESVEPHNPKVVRATMGAFFRTRLAVASGAQLVEAARRANYAIVAAEHGGEPLPGFDFPERVVLAIGNERHGVRGALPAWDRAVSIPQPGAGESLNAAVAGGIIFYAFSQRSQRTISTSRPIENP